MTAVQTTTTTTKSTTFASDFNRVTAWVKVVTHDLIKPASFVVGFLSAMGVTPAPEGRTTETAMALAVGTLIHLAETFKGTSTGNGA